MIKAKITVDHEGDETTATLELKIYHVVLNRDCICCARLVSGLVQTASSIGSLQMRSGPDALTPQIGLQSRRAAEWAEPTPLPAERCQAEEFCAATAISRASTTGVATPTSLPQQQMSGHRVWTKDLIRETNRICLQSEQSLGDSRCRCPPPFPSLWV